MAKTAKHLPDSYPQPLASRILKSETCRQLSMLRQEFASDLITLLSQSKDSNVRARCLKLVEINLRDGHAAMEKALQLWPAMKEAEAIFAQETRKGAAHKQARLFSQIAGVHDKSMQLLAASFESIEKILARLQPAPDAPADSNTNKRAATG
jgi:rubrerythrin